MAIKAPPLQLLSVRRCHQTEGRGFILRTNRRDVLFFCLYSRFVLSEVQNKNVSAFEPDLNVGGVDLFAAVALVTGKSFFLFFFILFFSFSLSNQQQKQVKNKKNKKNKVTRWAKPTLNLFFRRPCNHCEFRGCWEKKQKTAVFRRHSGVSTSQGQGSSEGAKDGCFAFFSVVKARRAPQISTQTAV